MPETVLPEPPGGELPALADRCVQCGLCLPHCPTYRLDAVETESPRGRIAYAKAVATGILAPTALGDLHLDHCLGCRRCEGACPAGVEYGNLLVQARTAQAERRPLPPASRRRLWLLSRPALLHLLLLVYRWTYALLPASRRPLPRPPAPTPAEPQGAGPVPVFLGCVSRTYEAPARAALSRLLGALGIQLADVEGQTCCGAAAEHAGDAGQAAMLAARNRSAFEGSDRVLCLASGCQATLGRSLERITRVQDPLRFLHEHSSRLRFRNAGGRRVALHRPCTQFALPGSIADLRALLALVPGLEVVELADRGCCGAAGLHMLQFPQRAQALAQPVLNDIEASGATEVISANVGCRLHLDDGKLPVRHPLELLAEFLE
jgi:glycolate oxidase iron-sulfur subunit